MRVSNASWLITTFDNNLVRYTWLQMFYLIGPRAQNAKGWNSSFHRIQFISYTHLNLKTSSLEIPHRLENLHNSWWGQGKEGRQRKRNILFHVQRILSWRHWSHCSGWFVAGVVCVASVWWASCCRVSGAHCSSWTPWRCSVPWLLRRSCTLRANTHTSTVSCEPVNNRITHITRHGTILMV